MSIAITFQLEKDISSRIKKYCDERGIPQSEFINVAIEKNSQGEDDDELYALVDKIFLGLNQAIHEVIRCQRL